MGIYKRKTLKPFFFLDVVSVFNFSIFLNLTVFSVKACFLTFSIKNLYFLNSHLCLIIRDGYLSIESSKVSRTFRILRLKVRASFHAS